MAEVWGKKDGIEPKRYILVISPHCTPWVGHISLSVKIIQARSVQNYGEDCCHFDY